MATRHYTGNLVFGGFLLGASDEKLAEYGFTMEESGNEGVTRFAYRERALVLTFSRDEMTEVAITSQEEVIPEVVTNLEGLTGANLIERIHPERSK